MLNNRTRRDVIFNRVPTKADLDAGDLVVNSADGIAYTKLVTGQVVPIAGRSISGESGGSSFDLPVATPTVLGGVKVGANLSITADGVLSAQQGEDGFVLLPATRSTLGGVIVGARLTVAPDGTLSADAPSLPIASGTVLGGVRVGQGLSIDGSGLLTSSGFDDRVLRAGDTMTGVLQFGSGTTAQFNPGSYVDLVSSRSSAPLQARTGTGDNFYLGFTASGGLSVNSGKDVEINTGGQGNYLFTSTMLQMDGGALTSYPGHNRTTLRDFVWAETDQGDGFGLAFATDGWTQYYATPGHRILAPQGATLELDAWGCYLNRDLYVNDGKFIQVTGAGRFQALAKTASNFLYAFAGGPSNAEVNFFFTASLNFQLQTNMAMLLEGNSAIRLRVAGSISYLFTPDNATFDRPLVYSRSTDEVVPFWGRTTASIDGLRLVDTANGPAVSVESLREHLPEALHELQQGGVGVCDSTILATLVGAVQELAARVAALEGN
jgi:hypothetical protein